MDLKRIYQMLSKLDADEEIGYAYYRQTGKNLDFFDMNRIKLHAPSGAKDFDFSYLESVLLVEQNHIAKNCNVELNYVPQYLDIPPHQHDFFEIVYTLRGKCGHRIETQTIEMQTGDIVIIPPHIEHFVFFPCQRAARLTSKSVKAPSTACLSISCKIKRSCPTTLPNTLLPKLSKLLNLSLRG